MQTAKVKKREGTIVDFDQSKIVEVIWKAHKSTGGGNRSLAEGLAFQVIESLEKKFKQEEILGVEQIQDAIEEVLIREEQTKIAKAFILYRQKRAEIRKAKIALGITDELKLPLNAIKVLEARYLRKDETGKVIETTAQLFQRVANVIASVESRYGKTDEEAKEKSRLFYEMMVKQEFLPNSPTLMNAGAGGLGMLSACFVLPVPDSIEGIFDAIKYTALIHRCGGGTGFSFSRLRPRGDIVRSTSGIASGPISFMKIFDCATEQIKQGGKRRGANMGVLRVDHPDILDFIVFKEKEGVLSNFNISVAITDKFMKAVMNDGYYDLINPKNGKVVSKMRARAVWNLIITMAWKTGDPGILFIDRINNSFSNPVPSLGPIESTNPCITSDTWIMTSDGAKQVKELIGKRFTAIVNSEKSETDKGFFLTGKKPVYKLITKEGFEVRLTADHPVLKAKKISRNTTKTEWAKVSDLNKGEKIALNVHRNFNGWEGSYGEEEGYLIGLLFGDGTITRNKFILGSWGDSPGPMNVRDITQQIAFNFSHRSDFAGWGQIGDSDEYRMSFGYLKKLGLGLGLKPKLKVINDCIEKTSSLFYDGFLRGMFDCDGSVQGNHLKGASIRLSQSNLDSLKAVQRMLLRRGIFSRIYQNRRKEGKRKLPDGKGGYKEYNIKAQHELVISNENILQFFEKVGFNDIEKVERLKHIVAGYKRTPNREKFVATVKEIIEDGMEDVYDVNIPVINCFDANGFIVHNCGEQVLYPYDSCNLGSINVSKMLIEADGGHDIDWDKLRFTVQKAVNFLDNVIDANVYVIPEIEKMTKRVRRIGLGVMGFADMLILLGVPYNSETALRYAESIMRFITEEARKASSELGRERGSFPDFENSIWKRLGYEAMRNSTTTTIAPTGTISIINGGCSQGIEPLFSIVYMRNVGESIGSDLIEVNNLFETIAIKEGFYSEELIARISKATSIHSIQEIPEHIRKLFVTAHDTSSEGHVKMQAAFQKYTDNAVSKTINFPSSATPSDVDAAYMLAYKLGCKGITVYRDKSKSVQILTPLMELEKEKPFWEQQTLPSAKRDIVQEAIRCEGCVF